MNVKQAPKAGGCARGGRGDTVRGGDREHRGDRASRKPAEKFIKKFFRLKMGSLIHQRATEFS